MADIKAFLAFAALAAGAAGAFAASPPVTSDQFSPGWQDQARALINQGASRLDLSKTSWYVPAITPRGRYILVERHGDKAQVIDGYEFRVTSDPEREIHMVLPAAYGNVEAVPISFVPSLDKLRETPGSR